MKVHTVPDGVQSMALARYLSRAYPMLPGFALRDALKKRDVRVNGQKWDGQRPVRGGDELAVYLADKYLTGPLEVLFADGRILAVEKPAGLPVDADGDGVGEDTLLARARAAYPGARLCHRLDAGTGGAMLLSLEGAAHEALLAAFKARQIAKTYQCVARGCPEAPRGTLVHYLQKDAAAARVFAAAQPRPGARRAELDYAVLTPRLAADPALALFEIELGTGRTHQIRAQLAAIGHPILGDDKYGDRALNKRLRCEAPCLWCVRLEILAGGALAPYRGRAFVSPARFALGERHS